MTPMFKSAAAYDRDVYRLCLAGYVGSEIRRMLGLSEEAFCSSLDRLADWLAPSTASKRSIDLSDCFPLEAIEGRMAPAEMHWFFNGSTEGRKVL